MDLKDYRNELDQIDKELMSLYKKRMEISVLIGKYKKEHNLPILDEEREKQIIESLSRKIDDKYKESYIEFLKLIIKHSKNYQE